MITQKQLINTAMMASSRKMKSVQRARDRDAGKSDGSVVIAQPAVAPASSPKRSRESSPVNLELNMPDEERDHYLYLFEHRCLQCGSPNVKLHVEFQGYRKYYRVECASIQCGHCTQMCEKSQDAIAVWKMQSLLSKP